MYLDVPPRFGKQHGSDKAHRPALWDKWSKGWRQACMHKGRSHGAC